MILEKTLLDKMKKGTVHFALIDPENQTYEEAGRLAIRMKEAGTDAFMIGGSTGITSENLDGTAVAIKKSSGLPTIYFPSSPKALPTKVDAMFFMSIVNSIDPNFIIGYHAKVAPVVKKYKLECISMGYIIIEPGMKVAKMGKAKPIGHNDIELAVGYAMACEYFGMHMVYLEAGSGADRPVSPEMIAAVKKAVNIAVIVGGGIRTPEAAAIARKAGADAIVTGTFVEKCNDDGILKKVVAAAKGTGE